MANTKRTSSRSTSSEEMSADGHELSDQEKVCIVSNFILHSPPGEFNEVFNDVRVLLNDDVLLKEGASESISEYNKDQLTPVKIENSGYQVLITDFNDIGGSRFVDARSKQTFKFDHLIKHASDFEHLEPDLMTETWRFLLEKELDEYIFNHYKNGVSSVFAKRIGTNIVLTACIENHQFNANNYWNARWRSQWTVNIINGSAEVSGIIKVQVHYYENGNVQLVSSKDIKELLVVSSEEQIAKDLVKLIEETETNYQKAISENYQTMSGTTFKALRRQLPVTRTKIDWNNLVGYSIGRELKSQ
ncbi:F-actin-capping protein subunit alpha-like [Macrosteles quadrilineatus]|uniref:F-actin-capping protein subunit alpha-like n=1 Tax=Macrosteles quadrilineatus TaxID=74068 RepID=UPI0023E253F7|nr:F-actin-capping protein subunit alpha-like [Macrosteles quadrilineatus]